VGTVNLWLSMSSDWLLIPAAMKAIAAALALALVFLVVTAMPLRARSALTGAWLRVAQRRRSDSAHAIVVNASDRAERQNFLPAACILRDLTEDLVGTAVGTTHPFATLSEPELLARLHPVGGAAATTLLPRLYKRLRALPTRRQAAAPWSPGRMTRQEFHSLHRDARALCRTLGQEL
jgi:hypothetical protein